jgi:hypothetical protein
MNNYLNIGGGATVPKKGFDPTNAIGLGLDLIVGTITATQDAKKMRELQEKLGKMSLEQQKELEIRLQDAKSQIARLDIMYKTFAVLEGQKLVDARKGKQLILLSILGGGTLILVGLAILKK